MGAITVPKGINEIDINVMLPLLSLLSFCSLQDNWAVVGVIGMLVLTTYKFLLCVCDLNDSNNTVIKIVIVCLNNGN